MTAVSWGTPAPVTMRVVQVESLSDVLKPLSGLSPWKWALGGDPLVNLTDPWRYAVLLLPAVALATLGVAGFVRRDVRAA